MFQDSDVAPIRVLLADDHPTFLNIATKFLEQQEGMVVVGAASGGREVLALARACAPHIVLIDLVMPDLPGLQVIPRLRMVNPALGIIALTLLDADGYRTASLAAGADDFVAKAAITDDLMPAIRRVARARAIVLRSRSGGNYDSHSHRSATG